MHIRFWNIRISYVIPEIILMCTHYLTLYLFFGFFFNNLFSFSDANDISNKNGMYKRKMVCQYSNEVYHLESQQYSSSQKAKLFSRDETERFRLARGELEDCWLPLQLYYIRNVWWWNLKQISSPYQLFSFAS